MNTQQNQNEIKKKGVQVNPSRDLKYDDKEKSFSGEFGEQTEASGEEINPSELDHSEVDLDRGGVEFGGAQKEGEPGQPNQDEQQSASPDVGMSSDLGGDISEKQKSDEIGKDLH